jgi:hypothetical protein
MMNGRDAPWKKLLADPGAGGHIVQLYQDDDFCTEAVSHFAAEGLARGEAVVLVSSTEHWQAILRRLAGKGFDPARMEGEGRLRQLDAAAMLERFMHEGMPVEARFRATVLPVLEQARARSEFSQVRVWGEMVNLLYLGGNSRASTRLEEFWGRVTEAEGIALLCSFLMDKFDPKIYDGELGDVCRCHGHVIPARDYAAHHEAVNRAVVQTIGELRGPLLHALVAQARAMPTGLPAAQALLLWLRQHLPSHQFREVLARASAAERGLLAAAPS